MKNLTLKISFALVSMLPLASMPAGSAQAQDRADLTQVQFVEVDDTPQTRQKYTFLQNLMLDESVVRQANPSGPTRILIGEVNGPENLSFVNLEGPLYCGVNDCQIAAYSGAGANAREVVNVSAGQPVYMQRCGDELALIFAGGGGDPVRAGKWVYNGTVFEFRESYAGLENVPRCP